MATLSTVAGLIPSLATAGGIDVERRGIPVKDPATGAWATPPPTLIHIEPAVIHNLVGRDREQLPEADRQRESIEVYTSVQLYLSEGANYSDVIIYRGRKFRVVSVMDYVLQGAVYITLAALQDPQAIN